MKCKEKIVLNLWTALNLFISSTSQLHLLVVASHLILQHSPSNYVIDISVRLSIFNLYQWEDWLKTDVIVIALNKSQNIFI